jgi:flavin reductase (DIM6/NTAB) family NADH-FMN oxidoreductase RutF
VRSSITIYRLSSKVATNEHLHSYAAIDCPPDVSEWELTGLTPVPSDVVKAPRVGESAFCMECTLEFFHDVSVCRLA